MVRRASSAVALACCLWLASCGSDAPSAPSGGPAAGGAPTPAPVATPAPGPGPVATPTPVPPNGTPSGNFGWNPAPVDGVVDLASGSTLRISAARFEDVDADALKLVADWGDGTTAHIGCGPCRLEKRYDATGSFDVVVTVTDRRQDGVQATADITERFTVRVRPADRPKVTAFTATPGNVVLGGSSTLAWTTDDAIVVRIAPGLGQQPRNGSLGVTPTATTTYTLRALDAAGQEATASVTVSVDAPAVGTFTATPTAIDIGQSSTLAWTGITGATSCAIDNGVGTVACADGSTPGSPTTAATYTLTATGPSGTATATASVSINPASITSFTSSPGNINLGASSTLAWNGITNATSCSIDNGVGIVTCADGSTSVSPSASTTYTLTANGSGGNDTATATVAYNPATAGALTASPTTIDRGASETSTLSWTPSTNATSCSIDNGVGGVSCTGGSTSVGPASTTTYTLTATGPGGSDTDAATVTVQYCHSISAGASECPSGAKQWCQAAPINAGATAHAKTACDTCRGSACGTAFCSGTSFGYEIPGSAFFAYDDASFIPCSPTFTRGDILDTGFALQGRWAP